MSFADRARKIIEDMGNDTQHEINELYEKRCKPYFNHDGSVVIPFDSDSRYHYWRGGQSITETEKEIKIWKH